MFDSYFGALSSATAFPEDQLRCLTALLLTYPLAHAFRLLPNNPGLKHIFSLFSGFFLIVGIMNHLTGLMHLLGSSIAAWRIMGTVKGKWGPRLVFIVVMLHMTANHFIRQYNDPRGYQIDHTGAQMIMTMKLTSWAFSVEDGRRNPKDLSRHQQLQAIQEFPPLLHYLSYIFFFPAVLVGPSFDYADYIRFVNLQSFTDPATGKITYPRGRVLASMKAFGFSLVALAALAAMGSRLDPFWCLEPEWKQLPFWQRFGYLQLVAFAARFKYYAVWKMAEGACILAGFGYNGKDPETGEVRWDASTNIDIWAYEKGESFKALADNWNMGTNKWLKYSVYVRVVPPGTKPGVMATFATFGVSALWHGISGGYGLFFLSAAAALTAGKMLRSHLRPRVVLADGKSAPFWYNRLGMLVTHATLNYLAISFLVLGFRDSLRVWKDLYFVGHVGVALILLLTPVVLPKKKQANNNKKEKSKAVVDPVEAVGAAAAATAEEIAETTVQAGQEILEGKVKAE
ncbi:lysophospholipid acyltransferase [Actinomortierella ambigua]|uniref:Lysophospholipid acyltransferase n=1 Tax=Actinomortierella ambigua TaxID=1343610 RepID=A0A9P6Q8G7_9FUNG|nr:lysophospholipid acyltransferase [Actinomortierella ambigua]